jgi:hypothetical protein
MSDNVVVSDSTDSLIDGDVKKVLNKRGRPTTALINANKKQKVGRPAGDNARIAEFKARILSTKGTAVIEKILNTALEDGHPAQASCMKMIIDRALPVSMFGDMNSGGSKPTIQINIAGMSDTISIDQSTSYSDDAEDGEYEEV